MLSSTVDDKPYWLIALTFIIAMLLTVLPLPHWAAWFRPEWVLLMFLYWHYQCPYKIGLTTAFILGLLLDSLYGSVFGLHSLALVIVSYLMTLSYRTLRTHGFFVQMMMILFIALAYQCALLITNAFLRQQIPYFWAYWAPAILCSILWPWTVMLFDRRVRHS